jgi:hypothetical protein
MITSFKPKAPRQREVIDSRGSVQPTRTGVLICAATQDAVLAMYGFSSIRNMPTDGNHAVSQGFAGPRDSLQGLCRPVARLIRGLLHRLEALESRRQGRTSTSHYLMMLDVEDSNPTLLPHCQANETRQLD